jgi:hypothetical protein
MEMIHCRREEPANSKTSLPKANASLWKLETSSGDPSRNDRWKKIKAIGWQTGLRALFDFKALYRALAIKIAV